MARIRGTTPEQYAGAFQHFDEIPYRYRLDTFSSHYSDDRTWHRYVDEVLLAKHDSERMRQTARLAGTSWLDHMASRANHHALASPTDVAAWCDKLLADLTRKYCYEHYFLRIYEFYNYLKESYRHPHLYNPFLIAAVRYESPRRLWMIRVDRRESEPGDAHE